MSAPQERETERERVPDGRARWTLDDGRVIYLLTLRQLDALPAGVEVIAIDGDRLVIGRDQLDRDTRFGYSAFGLPAEAAR